MSDKDSKDLINPATGITASDATIEDVLNAYEPADKPGFWQRTKRKAGAAISIAAFLGVLYLPGILSGCSPDENTDSTDTPVAAAVEPAPSGAELPAILTEGSAGDKPDEDPAPVCVETRYNFKKGTTDFTDDGTPEGVENFIIDGAKAGHDTFYVAGFASQEWGSNTELDDQPQNTKLARKRAYTLASIIHDIARDNNLKINIITTKYSEEAAFADEGATGEKLYAPNRTGVISTRPLEDPSEDKELAEELRSHDAGETYTVECSEEPEAKTVKKAGQAKQKPRPVKTAPKARAAKTGLTAPTQLGGQAYTPEPAPAPSPAPVAAPEAAPVTEYTPKPVPAPEGNVTIEKTPDGHTVIKTSEGAKIHFGAVPEEEPADGYKAPAQDKGQKKAPAAGLDVTEGPQAKAISQEEAQLIEEIQNFQEYSQGKVNAIVGYVNLAEKVVQECGENPQGSTLCSMESIDAKCGEDNLPYTPSAPGETTACREAQIEAELGLEMAYNDMTFMEKRIGELWDQTKQYNSEAVLDEAEPLITHLREEIDRIEDKMGDVEQALAEIPSVNAGPGQQAELSQTEYNPILDDALRDEIAEAFTAYDRYA